MFLDAQFRARESRAGGGLYLVGAALVLGALVFWLHFLGRSFVCSCGEVRLWGAGLTAKENSQQFADWYSILHLIFGAGLFLFVQTLRPFWSRERKLFTFLASSAVWEAVENTPAVIALFHDPANGVGYAGDSILNALGDTVFVLAGSAIAASLPRGLVPVLALAGDLTVWWAVDDGFLRSAAGLFA